MFRCEWRDEGAAVRMSENEWIAACGLDCGSCEIRRLAFDEKAAEVCLAWYREMGWLTAEEGVEDALARGMTPWGDSMRAV